MILSPVSSISPFCAKKEYIRTISCMFLYPVSLIPWQFARNQFLYDLYSTRFPRKVTRQLQSLQFPFMSGVWFSFPSFGFCNVFQKTSSTSRPKHPCLNRSIVCSTVYYTESEHSLQLVSKCSSPLTSESPEPGHWSEVIYAQFQLPPLPVHWCASF